MDATTGADGSDTRDKKPMALPPGTGCGCGDGCFESCDAAARAADFGDCSASPTGVREILPAERKAQLDPKVGARERVSVGGSGAGFCGVFGLGTARADDGMDGKPASDDGSPSPRREANESAIGINASISVYCHLMTMNESIDRTR